MRIPTVCSWKSAVFEINTTIIERRNMKSLNLRYTLDLLRFIIILSDARSVPFFADNEIKTSFYVHKKL